MDEKEISEIKQRIEMLEARVNALYELLISNVNVENAFLNAIMPQGEPEKKENNPTKKKDEH